MKSPTHRKIAALKPIEKRYSVALGYGLSLKVQPSGAKSFVLRLCVFGRVTDILLGHFPEMSLGEAKQAARRRRKEIGKEPPNGYVLADAFRLWCNLKKGRIVSYADERRRLERYIIKPSEHETVPGRLVFSASDSDSTYGRSYGVSVAAAYVLMIIKE